MTDVPSIDLPQNNKLGGAGKAVSWILCTVILPGFFTFSQGKSKFKWHLLFALLGWKLRGEDGQERLPGDNSQLPGAAPGLREPCRRGLCPPQPPWAQVLSAGGTAQPLLCNHRITQHGKGFQAHQSHFSAAKQHQLIRIPSFHDSPILRQSLMGRVLLWDIPWCSPEMI